MELCKFPRPKAVFQGRVIRQGNYNSSWSYVAAFISILQIQLTNLPRDLSPVTELRCWNTEHLSLLPVRSLPLSSTAILSNRKWLGPRSHRKSMRESEKEPMSRGAQCHFFCTERHCWRSASLCPRTRPKDFVQFNRMFSKQNSENSYCLLSSTGFCLRKIRGIFSPSCLIYTHDYKQAMQACLLFERQQLCCSKNPSWM